MDFKTETAANVKRLGEIVQILKNHKVAQGISPEKLRLILEDLGPTYIKLGQIMSMRYDMLPKEYRTELEKLRTDVKPMSTEDVKTAIEKSCGKSVDELFAEFDEKPLGSASIAQVHIAKLKTGEKVAVKVQRLGIGEKMTEDIRLMKKAAVMLKIAHIGGDVVDLHMVLDELGELTNQELNFLNEAENAARFSENNKNAEGFDCIKVYSEYTTREVLVMSYVGGYCISEKDKLKASGCDEKAIGIAITENYIKQILEDGFFHADPHPGNIKVCDGKIIWIDMGMMGTLSKRDRDIFSRCVKAIALGDVGGVKDAVLAISDHRGEIDHAKLYSDIEDLFNRYSSADMASMDMAKILDEGLKVCKENGISMPSGITMFCRGIATIQGVIAGLSPDVNLIQLTAEYVLKKRKTPAEIKTDAVAGIRTAADSGRKLLDIPALASELLKELVKGRTKINIEVGASQDLKATIEKYLRELITGIYAASLLLGSSLLCMTDMQWKILGIPAIGFIGFILAFATIIYLIFRSVKKK